VADWWNGADKWQHVGEHWVATGAVPEVEDVTEVVNVSGKSAMDP